MAKHGRRGERKAGNSRRPRQAARRTPARQHGRRRGPGDLIEETRRRLATDEPLDFLAYVSTLLAALDPHAENPFERPRQQDAVTVPALVESFGYDMTMIVYVDHNLGTVIKDGFPAPAGVDDVVSRLREASGDPDMRYGDISLSDARARISEAMEMGSHMFPPLETDTWPASRPLAEWLLRLLPKGGTGYVRPEWSQAALRKLANRFFSSPFGRRLDNKDNRSLLDQFLWFGTDYGPATRCAGPR